MNGEEVYLSLLYSIDCSGRSAVLSSLKHHRSGFSLSGLPSDLIAIGGWNWDNIKTCEKYSVATNKWTGLPSLNASRLWPASILLVSMRSFCFSGYSSVTLDWRSGTEKPSKMEDFLTRWEHRQKLPFSRCGEPFRWIRRLSTTSIWLELPCWARL